MRSGLIGCVIWMIEKMRCGEMWMLPITLYLRIESDRKEMNFLAEGGINKMKSNESKSKIFIRSLSGENR